MTPAQRAAYYSNAAQKYAAQAAYLQAQAAQLSAAWQLCQTRLAKLESQRASQHPNGEAAHRQQVSALRQQSKTIKHRANTSTIKAAQLSALSGKLCDRCTTQQGQANAQQDAISEAQQHNVLPPLPIQGFSVDPSVAGSITMGGPTVDCADLIEELSQRVRTKTRKNTALTLGAVVVSGWWLTQTKSGKGFTQGLKNQWDSR